jgi:hypothetical protein
MASFSHLPAELMEYVYAYLEQPAFYAVCQLNKSLHALAIPFLYRNVDLYIQAGNKVPRIDWFCLNVSKDQRLAARVESIRMGPSPEEDVKEGQRWIPRDRHFDDTAMFELAMKTLDGESLVSKGDYLRDALHMREYAAYAALILVVLPNLRALQIADFKTASLDHVHTALRNLKPGEAWNRRQASDNLMDRLSSIKSVTFNVDRLRGLAYPKATTRFDLGPILNLPGIQELEFSIPDIVSRGLGMGHGAIFHASPLWQARSGQPNSNMLQQLSNISRLVIRHSDAALGGLRPLLQATCQLQSLTYDFFYDNKERADAPTGTFLMPNSTRFTIC